MFRVYSLLSVVVVYSLRYERERLIDRENREHIKMVLIAQALEDGLPEIAKEDNELIKLVGE